MAIQEEKQSQKINRNNPSSNQTENTQNQTDQTSSSSNNIMISPRFKSVAAMAGWDEEALLLATLIVEDTPDRLRKINKHFKSPPTSSRRKRRARRRTPGSIPVAVFNLDDDDDDEPTINNDEGNEKKVESSESKSPKKVETDKGKAEEGTPACDSSSSTLPCMDRLREELSCAICLEICFEPSTTPCGHSFCKKCLRSAADKCGKRCPKCRQLISNGRSCTVNTVLWNTIQLLFPDEVEARKAAGALNSREAENQNSERTDQSGRFLPVTRRIRPVGSRMVLGASFSTVTEDNSWSRREDDLRNSRPVPSQDEDAAYALRLQREEFMSIYRSESSLARDNLRAMAQRAINLRVRHRAV